MSLKSSCFRVPGGSEKHRLGMGAGDLAEGIPIHCGGGPARRICMPSHHIYCSRGGHRHSMRYCAHYRRTNATTLNDLNSYLKSYQYAHLRDEETIRILYCANDQSKVHTQLCFTWSS